MKRTGGPISAKGSEGNGFETWNKLEMLDVLGEDVETEIQCGGTDDEILERDADAFGCLFAFDLAG